MGCFASRPKDSGGNRRKPTSIGDVSVYVPGLRIPKPVEFSLSLGDQLPKTLVERLTALRTRIVVMANQEGPTITRTRRKTQHGMWEYPCLCVSSLCFPSSNSMELFLAGGSTLADLHQALEDYLPVLLGLTKDGKRNTIYVRYRTDICLVPYILTCIFFFFMFQVANYNSK